MTTLTENSMPQMGGYLSGNFSRAPSMNEMSSISENLRLVNQLNYNSNEKLPYNHLQLPNNNSYEHYYPFNVSYQKPIYSSRNNLSTTTSTDNVTPLSLPTSSRDLFQIVNTNTNDNNGYVQRKYEHQSTSELNNLYRRHTENNLTLTPNKKAYYNHRPPFVNESIPHWASMHPWPLNNNPVNNNNNNNSNTEKRSSLPHSLSYGDFSLNGFYFPQSRFIGSPFHTQSFSSIKPSSTATSAPLHNSSVLQPNLLANNQQSRFISQSTSQMSSNNELPIFFQPMFNNSNLCGPTTNSVISNHAQLSTDTSHFTSRPSDFSIKIKNKTKQRITQRITQEILNLKQKCPTIFAWEIQQQLLQNGICKPQNLPSANTIHRVLRNSINIDSIMRLNSDPIDTKPNITTVMQALLDNFNPMNSSVPTSTFISSTIDSLGNSHSESSSRNTNNSMAISNINPVSSSSSQTNNLISTSPLTIYLSPSPSPSVHAISDSDTSISDPDTECSICLCSYKNGQEIHILSCTHEFHSNCLKQWIKKNNSCPICRRDITDQSEFITILI